MILVPSRDQLAMLVPAAPSKLKRLDGPPSAGMTYTSGGPSSRPTKATCWPSGEKRGRLASPTPAVSRNAGPPRASTRHRSSSHAKTMPSPLNEGKRKYPRSDPPMHEILTAKRPELPQIRDLLLGHSGSG